MRTLAERRCVGGLRQARTMSGSYPAGLDNLVMAQEGMLGREQALAAGLSPAAIRERLDRGSWQRIYPGVYATFTGKVIRSSELWATVLHAGAGAVLSHDTAAEADGLRTREGAIDVTAPAALHAPVPVPRRLRPARRLVIPRADRLGRTRRPAEPPPRPRIEETGLVLT